MNFVLTLTRYFPLVCSLVLAFWVARQTVLWLKRLSIERRPTETSQGKVGGGLISRIVLAGVIIGVLTWLRFVRAPDGDTLLAWWLIWAGLVLLLWLASLIFRPIRVKLDKLWIKLLPYTQRFAGQLAASRLREREGLKTLGVAIFLATVVAGVLMVIINWVLLTWLVLGWQNTDIEMDVGKIALLANTNANLQGYVIRGSRDSQGREVTLHRIVDQIEKPVLALAVVKQTGNMFLTDDSRRIRPKESLGNRFAFALAVRIDVFVPEMSREVTERRPLPYWWMDKNLAQGNRLVTIDADRWSPVRKLNFELAEKALFTYLASPDFTEAAKREGLEVGGGGLPTASEMKRRLAPVMRSVFRKVIDGEVQQRAPIVWFRVLNGWIQFATYVAFLLAALIVGSRLWLFIAAERALNLHTDRDGKRRELHDLNQMELLDLQMQAAKAAKKFERRWSVIPPQVTLLRVLLEELQKAKSVGKASTSSTELVDKFADLAMTRNEYRSALLRFLQGAIPALGFLGTVYGLGLALGGVGGVLSEEMAEFQSGISTVTLSLSIAFDTTLVGLVGSLTVNFFEAALDNAESSAVTGAREAVLGAIKKMNM